MLACSLSFACEPEQPEVIDYSSVELSQPQWQYCASQGQRCEFQGPRLVRYGNRNGYVTRTYSNGVLCTAAKFGSQNTSGRCWFDASGGVGGSGAMQNAGGSGVPTLPTAGTSATDHSAHTAAGGGAGAMASGPYIDMSSLPTGDPGSSRVQIEATTEKPAGSDGTGAFRNECMFTHMSKNDPIVFPGQPGMSHLHTFFGNTGVNADSTADSIRTSGNSSCRAGIANRTGYWVPALIDGSGHPLKPKALEVYYKSGYNGIKPAAIKPFPSGLRMIAGDAKSSAPQSRAYWGCAGNYIGHPGSIPNCNAGDAVQMSIEFPQCWDGKNLDSSDHKSHMSYPQNGACPATHPVPIPAITFNVLYPLPSNGDTSKWRLASDMYDASLPGGMSAHADWFDGWDPAVVKAFVEHCINPAVDCHSHLLGDGRRIF